MMVVDEVLRVSGDFGPAQWLMLALFSAVNVLSAFHYYAQTFLSLSSTGDACHNVTSAPVQQFHFHTLTDELGWTCESKWKTAVMQSLFFVGSVVGTLLLGMVADRMGRRPALVIANMMAVLGNLLTAFLIPNLVSLSIARFVAGLAVDANFFMMYIIVMEYIKPSLRTVGLNLCIGVWYCIGCMATPWLAVLCQDWRVFLTAVSLPTLIVPIVTFFIPESAQWLISRGRREEALECFQKLAAINRKTLPPEYRNKFEADASIIATEPNKGGSVKRLFETPKLRKKTCILIFKTMVLTLCYDAISRNIEGLGYDPYTMFTVQSATIFPACVVILILQDRVGRKALAVLALLLTGLLNLVQATCVSTGLTYTAAIVGVCSRFAVNIAYNSGTQYAAELIPTQVRGQGLSLIHVVGYVATFFSPHILFMSSAWAATPGVVLGTLAVMGAFFCMLLPETLGRTLPNTIEDGEAFGEDDKFWQFSFAAKKNKPDNMNRL